jgi:hypothetical protein
MTWQPFLTTAEACHRYAITATELVEAMSDGLEWLQSPVERLIPTVMADEFFAGKLRAVA